MNHIMSTATVISKPVQHEKQWSCTALSNRSYTDRNNVQVVTGQLFYLISTDFNVLPNIGKGSRIGFKGNFVGTWEENEQYPNSFSCGGPTVWKNKDTYTTAFMVECSQVVSLGKGERVAQLDQQDMTWISLAGKITAKGCDLKYRPDGTAIAVASLAVKNTKRETVNGEKVTTNYTVFFRLTLWGDRAESVAKNWKPKSPILVEGDLVIFKPKKEGDVPTNAPNIWFDKDGNAKATYELHVSTWSFAPNGNGHQDAPPERNTNYGVPSVDDEETIPF